MVEQNIVLVIKVFQESLKTLIKELNILFGSEIQDEKYEI